MVARKKKAVLVQELRDRKYEAFPPGGQKTKTTEDEIGKSDDENDENEDAAVAGGARDYDYLLSVSFFLVTEQPIAAER